MDVCEKQAKLVGCKTKNMPAETNKHWNVLMNPGDFKAFI